MSKASRIELRKKKEAEQSSKNRETGFYIIETNGVTGQPQEPAYWNGKEWWFIGWECPVLDLQTDKIIKKLEW